MMLKRTLNNAKKVASLMTGRRWRLDNGRIRTGSCEWGRLMCPLTWAAKHAGGGNFSVADYVDAACTLGINAHDALIIATEADNLGTPTEVRQVLLREVSA